MNALRAGLPPLTNRLKALPVDARGYPIPWFVAYIDGKPDFRIADSAKRVTAVRHRKCWICGQPTGTLIVFVAGPMCGINRTSSDPAAHRDCAEWSVRACPFLLLPKAARREANLPADHANADGELIPRNPGVTMLWVTRTFNTFRVQPKGWLIRMGEPHEVLWFREGRPATRAEVMESVDSGLPILADMAASEGKAAVAQLHAMVSAFMPHVPEERQA